MATYLYGRCSTTSQDTDNQMSKLREQYPHATEIHETASGAKRRPELEKLLDRLVKGDVLVVYSLDRLGRRTSEVLSMIEMLEAKGIILKSIREGVDYSSSTGKLITQILCSVAEMERNLISERTKLALSAKRKKGIVGGRKSKYSEAKINEVKELRAKGLTLQKISEATGVSISRIHQLTKGMGPLA